MSYDAFEVSRWSGEPIELYRFKRRADCWFYTSAEVDVAFEGDTYRKVPISRSEVERSDDSSSDKIEVSVDPALAVVPQFMFGVPASPVGLRITRLHRSDAEAITLFAGEVQNAQVGQGQVTLHCVTPLGLAAEKKLPRVPVQRQCSHVLYDAGCGLDPADFQVLGTITQILGAEKFVVPETAPFETGYFKGGFIRIVGTDVRLFITQHGGFGNNTISVLTGSSLLQVDAELELYPGCDRRIETCLARFDNVPNHMGFPFMPKSSPFDDLEVER